MSYRVVLAAAARAQLDSLYDYIAEAASPAVALGFTSAILGRLDMLQQFPTVGVGRDDILPELRTLGFRRRVTIAFVVEADQVVVLGLFYGGQDFERLLRED